jgi:molybdopterin-guanine dinucleotide biosynthesis protein B
LSAAGSVFLICHDWQLTREPKPGLMGSVTQKTTFATFLGWSGSGKTTLVVRAIEACRRRGISCAAAKRARHPATIAPEGKDSSLFLAAGAEASAYVGDSGAAIFLPPPAAEDRAYFSSLLPATRLVFLEGAEVAGALRILVAGAATDESGLKRPIDGIDILVAFDADLRELARARGKAAYSPDEADALVEFLLEV